MSLIANDDQLQIMTNTLDIIPLKQMTLSCIFVIEEECAKYWYDTA